MGGIGSGAKRNESLLLGILDYISHDPKSITDIADHFETSERTVYRYIKHISNSTPIIKYLLSGKVCFKVDASVDKPSPEYSENL